VLVKHHQSRKKGIKKRKALFTFTYTYLCFMKKNLFCILLLVTATAVAQKTVPALKDSVPAKMIIKNSNTVKKTVLPVSLTAEIEAELNKIVTAYSNQPNTSATWVQIKAAAENLLYNYFKNGKLMGIKTAEAYFVKMGAETMPAADLAAKKMILFAGIATAKPGEFTVLRIEKTNNR
jgi:phage tail sheath protein FI